jgi:hypothetical protein
MFKKTITGMLLLLTICGLLLTSFPYIASAQETNVSVNPSIITGLEIGNTFQVNITVSDVTDLYAWQFRLFYRNDILNATNWSQGSFLLTHPSPAAQTIPAFPEVGTAPDTSETYNATHGLVHLYVTLSGVHGGVSGTGTLATITFEVKGEGDSILDLRPRPDEDFILIDSAEPFANEIPHTTTDGMVHVGLHDIAIISAETSKTIANDTIVYINVTVENQGQTTETFDVTAYYDSTPIETKTVTDLTQGTSTVITLTWDTNTVSKGNYTISTTATTIPGETDIADNTYTNGWVLETIAGDVNGDGQVNILDIAQVAVAFGTKPGYSKWDPNADINNDNEINILDISTVAIHFGEVDP